MNQKDNRQLLYLDNFRGFQATTIPLSDVNFCVGENSTGKTSFLTLIRLLASPKFWFSEVSDSGEFSFGHFDDIVSVNAKKRSCFRVGHVERQDRRTTSKSPEEKEVFFGFLFAFRKKDGMPYLHKVTSSFLNYTITAVFGNKSIRYWVDASQQEITFEDFQQGLFETWAKLQDQPNRAGYQLIADDFFVSGNVPGLFALAHIRDLVLESQQRKVRRKYFSIPRPSFGGELAWIAPIRTKPRRTYDEVRLEFSPEGEHTPYVVKKILDSGTDSEQFLQFLERFGRESGLFREINVHRFGTSITSPFELEIMLEAKPLNISNVGYGVSQALPIAVELFVRPEETWFALQQPEVHLHPRAQAAFGEMIFQLSEREKKRFIVETHSDYTIDRYRVSVRDGQATCSAQILFFERSKGNNVVTPIPIDKNGDIGVEPPKHYREFFLNEELRVLGVN